MGNTMKKLSFGIAGLGRIGKIHLGNLLELEGVEVVAAMDPTEEGRQYAKDRNIPHITSSYGEMLSTAPLDAVLICSPTDTHADYVEQAARAGIHVFCEK